MQTNLKCLPCLLRQAISVMELHAVAAERQEQLLAKCAQLLFANLHADNPPAMAKLMYQLLSQELQIPDLFYQVKKNSTQQALALYPKLQQFVAASNNRLATALELAGAGNIIDYGAKHNIDIDYELDQIRQGLIRSSGDKFNTELFAKKFAVAQTLLILGDNAGETVFDRLLIEELIKLDDSKTIYYAVKGSPILNDAILEDAIDAGLDKVATIISSGSDAPGTVLDICTDEFKKIYQQADLVLSKGQGNFEALTPVNREIFFLFKIKCPVITEHYSNWQVNDMILTCLRPNQS